MIDWFLNMPWVVLLVLIVGGFAAFGVVGLSLTRRLIMPRLGNAVHQNEATGVVAHGILVIYGLAVALLAIAVWEKYAEATRVVASEAAAIGAIYRDVSEYPEPVRARLQIVMKAYTETTIHDAWPLQRRGKIPSGGVEVMDRFQHELMAFEPATPGQQALHEETLRAYNMLIQARRLRLHFVTIGLPAPMWAVVLVGALITIAATFFFHVDAVRVHRLMVVLLSGIMGLMIFLMVYYDQPLRGSHSVSSEAYELIHEQLMAH